MIQRNEIKDGILYEEKKKEKRKRKRKKRKKTDIFSPPNGQKVELKLMWG